MTNPRPSATALRRAEFRRVTDFLETQNVKLHYGWQDGGDPIYHGGHRNRQLADKYAAAGPTDKEKQDG